jgi:hypothetical protein
VIEEERRRRSQSEQNMVYGKLEVLLVSAKGLEDTDFLSKPLSFLLFSLSLPIFVVFLAATCSVIGYSMPISLAPVCVWSTATCVSAMFSYQHIGIAASKQKLNDFYFFFPNSLAVTVAYSGT